MPPLESDNSPTASRTGKGKSIAAREARQTTAFAQRWHLYRYTPSVIWYHFLKPLRLLKYQCIGYWMARRFRKPALCGAPRNGEVLVVGPLSARNGLGRAARYELSRITQFYPDVGLVDITSDKKRLGTVLARPGPNGPPRVVIFLVQPYLIPRVLRHVEPAALAKAWRIGLSVLELPYAPPHWQPMKDFFHEVWTPSYFSAQGLHQFMRAEVKVVPHSVQCEMDDYPYEPLRDGVFRGLAIMDLGVCPDRKNPWAHIEAWQKAFGDDETAILSMKLRFSRRTRAIRLELERMIGDSRNIRTIEQEMSDAEILDMQRAADVGLSLHRAEGYGLTIQEMLELGKPVIATGWSGNMMFMGDYPNAYTVPYRLVPYRDYLNRYPRYRGEWADADTDAAARALRKIREDLAAGRAVAGRSGRH